MSFDRESLCDDEKKDFIKAVQCLREKPSIADPDFAKAARTRYDDLTAVHVNLTNFVHATGSFLTWHRYFVWSFEIALRDECGYPGYMPVSTFTWLILCLCLCLSMSQGSWCCIESGLTKLA
jgi:tyrosinase